MLANLKLYATLGAAAVLGLAYWHYTSVVDDLAEAQSALAVMTQAQAAAEELAEANAAVAQRADDERRAAVAALEAAHAELTAVAEHSRAAEAEIDRASEADDGPVAPLLDALRRSRFGGSR